MLDKFLKPGMQVKSMKDLDYLSEEIQSFFNNEVNVRENPIFSLQITGRKENLIDSEDLVKEMHKNNNFPGYTVDVYLIKEKLFGTEHEQYKLSIEFDRNH